MKRLRVLVLVHPDLIPPDSSKGFSEQQIAVVDHRRGADRMKRLVAGRRQHGDGVACGVFKLIGKAKFFAEPDDPLGLRFAEMVNDEHRDPPLCMARTLSQVRRKGRR